MESSEDDAGTATSASRRASAREKDVGLAEDVDAARNFQHESSEARASCGTPAMSEDNFDGDSVPSPSAKDTSTEAILDMIDDFIDGPGAPRRLPIDVKTVAAVPRERVDNPTVQSAAVTEESQHNIVAEVSQQIPAPPHESSSCGSVDSETISKSTCVQPVCAPHSEIVISTKASTEEQPAEASSSVQVNVSENCPTQQPGISVNVESEVCVQEPVVVPMSSSAETVQVKMDTSECDNQERTVKCVTSSEIRDNVTVELAESTSSECSVSESKGLSVEPLSRSPLKRRLIRPTVSDRRPDSTVSSTADSQTTDIDTTEQTSSDTLTKDVSSSSDALTNIHGNSKPEEIRNVSEISICKAETSTASSRKIKLVRPKVTTAVSESAKTEMRTSTEILDRDQCQSTSSDDISTPSSDEPSVENISNIIPAESEEQESRKDCEKTVLHQSEQVPELAQDVTKILKCELVEEKSGSIISSPELIKPQSQPNQNEPSSPAQSLRQHENLKSDISLKKPQDDSSDAHQNKVAKEITECQVEVSTCEKQNAARCETFPNDIVAQCSTVKFDIPVQNSQDEGSNTFPPAQKEIPQPTNRVKKVSEHLENVNESVIVDENIKLLPNKLNLDNADDNKNAELLSAQNSGACQNILSPKIQDSTKQVPKLTIKFSNKQMDEKSSVPKLTIKPLRPPVEQNQEEHVSSQEIPIVTKINIKPIQKPIENISKPLQPTSQKNTEPDTELPIPTVTKINIKPIPKLTEKDTESIGKTMKPSADQNAAESNTEQPSVTKINIKPISKQTDKLVDKSNFATKLSMHSTGDDTIDDPIPALTKINIKPIPKPTEKFNEIVSKPLQLPASQNCIDHDIDQQIPTVTKINIKPIPKPTEKESESMSKPTDQTDNISKDQIPVVTKLNIKPIVKPKENDNVQMQVIDSHQNELTNKHEIPNVTKLNIKPIPKPPEKITETHRKSSSSEISESEYSENDESTSTDQASASDQGPSDSVPKVTIKLGKPGTESEGKFYTEKNIPKLTIKNIQHGDKEEQDSKLKVVVSPSDNKQQEKIPKITIKAVTRSESQQHSPKLTIKPLKPPENVNNDSEIPKLKLSEAFSSSTEVKENFHIPKITIKPVTKSDGDATSKTPKKSTVMCDSSENIPVVTKLNIKPILKPTESGESSINYEEKVPVVSKLNIKPVIKPKDSEVDSSIDDVPKVTKLNIKPLKNPEESSSEEKDCDEKNADMKDSSIPVVTKLNIKPIVKPVEDEALKDSENQSSETGNSSDDNADHIPIVTKINIKPIVKPCETEESTKPVPNEQSIPVVTKLNIKPLVKPEEQTPSSPKKESVKSPGNAGIPVITKLNIKPIVKPEDTLSDENIEKSNKQPSLVMKINMKNVCDSIIENEHLCNNIAGKAHSPRSSHSPKAVHSPKASHSPKAPRSPKVTRRTAAKDALESNAELHQKSTSSIEVETLKNTDCNPGSPSLLQGNSPTPLENSCVTVTESIEETNSNTNIQHQSKDKKISKAVSVVEAKPDQFSTESIKPSDTKECNKHSIQINEINESSKITEHLNASYTKTSVQHYTLLKKLLSTTIEDKTQDIKPSNCLSEPEKLESTISNCNDAAMVKEEETEMQRRSSPRSEKVNDLRQSDSSKMRSIQDVHKEANESVTKPLEISIGEKISHQGSGQDSPRIILKINKTDHGASSKIITDESHKPISPTKDAHVSEHSVEKVNDSPSPKKQLVNSRRKAAAPESPVNLTMGKRLRSSRIVETPEKSPVVKRNVNKRPSASDTSPPQHKESELSILETKRMKLEQLLSVNKTLTITPVVSKNTQTSPSKSTVAFNQGGKVSHNHSLLNENSQKNGNSKLHNILSNLQAKQMQTLQLNDSGALENPEITEIESSTSTASSDVIVEITRVENCHPEVQEMLINENSVCDLTGPDEVSQDPLEVEPKATPEEVKEVASIQTIELTPTPRKRGRPRKLPLPDAKPATPAPLPVPALEERPQRSLRLMRDRPAILKKPRGGGRGRGRGGRRPVIHAASPPPEPPPEPEPEPEPEPVTVIEVVEARPPSPIDPTSSRIKLPRMTEALDKSVAGASCATPLTSRRRSSADLKLFGSAVVLDSPKSEEFMKTPEATRPKSGRGSRGGRGRTPRNRGRGRGGGRGAMYMKETMGIYGRVCGPATTTVQLFEEETCMMDDNATPSKPSHLLDEDSQSSVKSSTNDSNKMKKSKFADLFDSNKIWTAADVKEYSWAPPDTPNEESQVMMIQEQVAMFLGVKSFKRRYPELKRRTVVGEEREYVLSKGLVTEALCDLGITAVDASEVLDIMLSDYPHKYEEYRSHQRERQIAAEETVETKTEEKITKVEVKQEKSADKPEPPKVDPEKTRQDMAAAAIASASEWNARANAWRRPACVDLQSMTVHRRRAPPAPPPTHVRPPAGFYPHALLPGQFQHWYRTYTSEQLRYFPLNTVVAAPPAPPSPADSSSESEGSWGSSSDDSHTHHTAKRKKLTRTKRSSNQERDKEDSRGAEPEVDLCRTCNLRLEANRKHTHERFLVCAKCNAKLHPGCVELPADTIRKCREYAWQCAECKSCCACRRPQDDDKMLFCDLCDRGFHIYCVGLPAVPSGRWHCVECAICKSCGARDPNGLAPAAGPSTPGPSTPGTSTPGASTPATLPGISTGEWHHQTKRGPGGHKVYSHSLCTPCARAYRIGRYCPLCDRSFIGPKGTMQLVICKLCDRQLHQECVRATVSQLRVLDYTCAECRRGGITSRSAAVRVAPRTIATLFMAKRRFNKYAHRQYLASRARREGAPPDPEDSDPLDPLDPPPPDCGD